MHNQFSLRSVFLIVLISIFAAFFSGGVVMAIGLSTSHASEKLFTFISFIIGQGFMLIPL